MTVPTLPDSAPFSPQQRAWLNGFFAALLTSKNGNANGNGAVVNGGASNAVAAVALPPAEPVEDFPWHDATLPIVERMTLAEGKPHARRMMAAMAQLDCGACGYLCKTYSEAIARGDEKDLTKCTPGGGDTAKMLKRLVAEEKANPTAAATESNPSAALNGASSNGHRNGAAPSSGPSASPLTLPSVEISRENPCSARLVSSVRLTHPDAPKDTRHVVIDLLDSGLTYEPGDSLGILPHNCDSLVREILALLHRTGGETVELSSGRKTSLRYALTREVTLTKVNANLFELLSEHAIEPVEKAALREIADADEHPQHACDLSDVLSAFPSARPPLADLIAALPKLQPRLYSISSSQRVHPTEVHLTVGVVQFEALGKHRGGVASNFLGVRSLPGDEVRVFVQRSPKFRLPENPETPVIMIGPGTGVAPFRAFLQERQATGAKGKSWLFFGNQYIDFDFLYRDELSKFCDAGALTKLELAFSRDTAQKVYVQDKMLEHGAELYRWIEEGACLYVCGDARRMAVDVDQALRSLIATHGRMSDPAARDLIKRLIAEHRYHKDVY